MIVYRLFLFSMGALSGRDKDRARKSAHLTFVGSFLLVNVHPIFRARFSSSPFEIRPLGHRVCKAVIKENYISDA